MERAELVPDSGPVGSLPTDRRSDVRHGCRIKILFNKPPPGQETALGEATWQAGKILNISERGIALVTNRVYFPGTVLSLVPIIPGWNTERYLRARVTNLRQEPGFAWCAGCELLEPLSNDDLELLNKHVEQANFT
jgi:hypothetical protein